MKSLILASFVLLAGTAFGQMAPTAGTITATLDHTHCSLAQTPQADGRGPGVCIATDGLWVQFSADVTPRRIDLPAAVVAGVTSLNGKTGDLTVSALPTPTSITIPSFTVPASSVTSPSVTVSVK